MNANPSTMNPTNKSQNIRELIKLIYKYILEDNIDALAAIARQKGLPPYLRYRIWPILLRKHPFVLNPFISPNYDVEDQETDVYEIPIKQIRHDLRKYFQKNFIHNNINGSCVSNNNNNNTNNNTAPNSSPTSNPYSQLTMLEQKIFKTLEYSIVKFLKKWGSIFHYEPGITWLALNLAEWLPPLYNNKHYLDYNDSKLVLLGKDTCLRNIINSHHGNHHKDSLLHKFIEDNELSESSCIIDLFLGYNLNFSNFLSSENNTDFQQFLKTLNAMDAEIPLKYKLSFPEIYERLVLVFLHCDEPSDEELELYEQSMKETNNIKKYGNFSNVVTANNSADVISNSSSVTTPASSSPSNTDDSSQNISPASQSFPITPVSLPSSLKFTITSGSVHDRTSFFLNLLKKLVPELYDFLKQEQLLTSSIFNLQNSNSEWLTWWVKWFGCKIFNKFDRGRIWDFVLGWRFQKDLIISDQKNGDKSDYVSELNNLLASENDSDSASGLINGFYSILDHKQIKKLTNLKFFDAQKSEDSENDFFFYNSIISYQIEILFFYISVLKSKENLILELDQSETKQFLNYSFAISSSSSSNLLDKKKLKLSNYYYVHTSRRKASPNLADHIDEEGISVSETSDDSRIKKPNLRGCKNHKHNNLNEVVLTNNAPETSQKSNSQVKTDETALQSTSRPDSIASSTKSPVVSPQPHTFNMLKFTSSPNMGISSMLNQFHDELEESKSTVSSNASTTTSAATSTAISTSNILLAGNGSKLSKQKNLRLLVDSSNDSIDELIGSSYKFWKVWINRQFSLMNQSHKKF